MAAKYKPFISLSCQRVEQALRNNGARKQRTQKDGETVEYDTEPAPSDWLKLQADVLSLLPVDDDH